MKYEGNNGQRDFHRWDLEGKKVRGFYLQDIEVVGTVVSSRVKYGGKVQHWIMRDKPVWNEYSNEWLDSCLLEDSFDAETNELVEIY